MILTSVPSPQPSPTRGEGALNAGSHRELNSYRKTTILREVSERNAAFFETEANKIDSWADDLKVGLQREIKEFDRQIKEAWRSAVSALTLEEKLEVQKLVRHLEGQRNIKRRVLFEAQDEIDSKREVLITEIEGKLQRKESILKLFVIRWGLV